MCFMLSMVIFLLYVTGVASWRVENDKLGLRYLNSEILFFIWISITCHYNSGFCGLNLKWYIGMAISTVMRS